MRDMTNAVGMTMLMFPDWNCLVFEELQTMWRRFTPDRRYKLWFCATSRDSAIMRVGSREYYMVRDDENTLYIRDWVHDYGKRSCVRVCHFPNIGKYQFSVKWCRDHKI